MGLQVLTLFVGRMEEQFKPHVTTGIRRSHKHHSHLSMQVLKIDSVAYR